MSSTGLGTPALGIAVSLLVACSQSAATGNDAGGAGAAPAAAPSDASAGVLRLVQTIPISGVEGRIDHLSVDLAGKRLFVAALGNNTIEVVDLATSRRVKSLSGFNEPQGVAFLADVGRFSSSASATTTRSMPPSGSSTTRCMRTAGQ